MKYSAVQCSKIYYYIVYQSICSKFLVQFSMMLYYSVLYYQYSTIVQYSTVYIVTRVEVCCADLKRGWHTLNVWSLQWGRYTCWLSWSQNLAQEQSIRGRGSWEQTKNWVLRLTWKQTAAHHTSTSWTSPRSVSPRTEFWGLWTKIWRLWSRTKQINSLQVWNRDWVLNKTNHCKTGIRKPKCSRKQL